MSDSIALATRLSFHGNKEGSNLIVGYSLMLPATTKELDTFVKASKKFSGSKEVEIAPGLQVVHVRGGEPKGKIVGSKFSTEYVSLVDAINAFFNISDDETLIYDEGEEMNDEGDETEGE